MKQFDLSIYRRANQDLAGLSDEELRQHFFSSGRSERRVFAQTESATETMSMRWLRGHGLEIGAGRSPTPLVEGVLCHYADIAADSAFGGSAQSFFSLEGQLADEFRSRFDFVIASHVLEHCDSFIRGFENLLATLKPSGVGYVILPDKRYLFDHHWVEDYSFQHHVAEYRDPLAFAAEHDRAFLGAMKTDPGLTPYADLSPALAQALRDGRIPQAERFISHKHNYRFADWIKIVPEALEFVKSEFVVEDASFGRERMDCHFILVRR